MDADDAVRVERVGRDDARLGKVGAPATAPRPPPGSPFGEALVVTVPRSHTGGNHTMVSINGDAAAAEEPAAQHLLVVAEELSESLVVLDHRGYGPRLADRRDRRPRRRPPHPGLRARLGGRRGAPVLAPGPGSVATRV
ncbi:hypothetical protein [Georgenia sp. SUBG003]|uniref:hypothetical protein n=1 Tax=Georgenia sp. SUBG003 TaxID=1497974 RepID=UPI003AB866BF